MAISDQVANSNQFQIVLARKFHEAFAAAFAPFYQMLIWGTGPMLFAIGVMSLLLTWRHAANLQRLFAGTEAKLGGKGKGKAGTAPAHPTHPTHHKKGH